MTLTQYITKINTLFQTGNAEHSTVGFAESFNGHFTNILLKGHKVAGRT
jgi:hypothetical protein